MESNPSRKSQPSTEGEPPERRRPITSADLARKLGVSITTISFVLNGLAEEKKIAPKTAARVRAAAEKYNYIPNPFARSLLTRRSGIIGVILGNFKMDYAEGVMRGMHLALDNTERVPFVAMHGFDSNRNRRELLASLARRDEGIIAFPLPGCNDIYQRIFDSGVPLVLFGEVMPGLEEISSVTWDAESAARAAVQHLVDTGRQRIAFLGVDYPGIGNLGRLKAYREVLARAGLPVREKGVFTPPAGLEAEEISRMAVEQFFPAKSKEVPDAIFAINDGLALPMLEELRRGGLRVPEDVAVIGMQDLPFSGHPAIGLSTVREPVRRMGEHAGRILLDLIEGRARQPVRLAIQSAEILVRRTTATES